MNKIKTIWDHTMPGIGGDSIVQFLGETCVKVYDDTSLGIEKVLIYHEYQNTFHDIEVDVEDETAQMDFGQEAKTEMMRTNSIKKVMISFLPLPDNVGKCSFFPYIGEEEGMYDKEYAMPGVAAHVPYIRGNNVVSSWAFTCAKSKISRLYPKTRGLLHYKNFKVISQTRTELHLICTDVSQDIPVIVTRILDSRR